MDRSPIDPVAEAHRQWVAHGWAEAADGMAAVTSVMRAQQIFLARADAVLRPLGLTFARYEVLMLLVLSRTGTLPLKLFGVRLQVHPTSVTNALDRLERAGLAARQRDPDDGRAVLVSVTDAGRGLAQEATARLNADLFLEPGMAQEDLTRLVDLLGGLRSAAGDF